MSKRRTRGSLSILGDIDDLLGISTSPASSRNAEDASFADGDPRSPLNVQKEECTDVSAPLRKYRRVSCTSRDAVSSPTASSATAGESLGGDEIDLLRRKDEETADMALFLAKAVGEAPSQRSLRELVGFLETTGIPRVLLSLQRGEAMEAFLHSLALAYPAQAERVLLLCILLEFMEFVSLEVFFQGSVLAFLVDSLAPCLAKPQETAAASPVRVAAHWSARATRPLSSAAHAGETSPSPPRMESRDDELRARVEALCSSIFTGDHSTGAAGNCAALSLRALLALVFEHNRSLTQAAPSDFSVPLAFVREGGLERLRPLLLHPGTRDAALSLLEVLTASDVLRREKARLLGLVPALVDLLNSSSPSTQASVLKVITNVTNLLPSAFSDTCTVKPFVGFTKSVLLHPVAGSDVDERETFTLCCCINVVRYEAREDTTARPTFSSALTECGELLPAVASSMTRRYHRSESEQLVLSGYAALLLGALSLVVVEPDSTTLRVRVMTAVAAASQGTRIGKLTDCQPMRMVAAIIQEFLLFQSSSGTLTREALLEMDSLVGRIRQHNHISLAVAFDEDSVERSESDGDDFALGKIL